MIRLKQLFQSDKNFRSVRHVLEDQIVFGEVRRHWKEAFGRLADDLEPVFYRDKTLFIESRNPAWVTEVGYFELDVIKNLNRLLGGGELFKKVSVKFSPQKETAKRRSVRGEIGKDLGEKIRMENQQRRTSGEKLCSACREVYSIAPVCVFCRCS
jgi:hypothetical protein